ncbi:MAG: hypothetical protein IPL04_08655 [Chitinophagaceae bacterium]|nr:hypothetical protein [Chitinophagaceae bacterium]
MIRYKNNSKDIKYRVIVLSRNLTFDRSWDVAFQMEGEWIQDRQNNFRNTKPLIDFVNYLSGFEKINWLKSFVADLGKTNSRLHPTSLTILLFTLLVLPVIKKYCV